MAQDPRDNYPIELTPPDITPYRDGGSGIDYATTFDSGKSGPHAMISAVVHGNELCGAIALDHLFTHGVRPIRGKLSLSAIRLVRRCVREQDIDIVFATNSKSIPNCAFACIGLDVKLVAYRGTASGLYAHDPSNYLGMLHPRIDGVICASDYVADYVRQRPGMRSKAVVSIYKGHEVDWYAQQAADLAQLGIPGDAFTVICVTNARPHKGLDIVLEATQHLADVDDLHLLLVGRGMDRQPYASLGVAPKRMASMARCWPRQASPSSVVPR